jgi:hypothetical protein
MSNLAPALSDTGPQLSALIAGVGERAPLRFVEFFTVNIHNRNTRAAYARAAANFLGCCERYKTA